MNEESRTLTAAPDEDRPRLDKFLALHCPDLSRTRIKALIEQGQVRADGATISDPSARVKPGQIFAILIPDATPAVPIAQAIPLSVAYEDSHLLVIDKPAGLVVHPAAGNPDATLVNALLAHCGDGLSGIGGVRRPGIVHRIDKDTSGLMVIAKTDAAHQHLARQFAVHSLERAYQAVVWGVPRPREGEIAGSIGRSPVHRKKMAVVTRGGKAALTRYKVLKVLAGGAASLVECRLETGRTHQIRVHLTSIGHPLVGDSVYGRKPRLDSLPASSRETLLSFSRQALHAFLIGFVHPVSGERVHLSSPLPNDISALITSLDMK